MASSYCIFASFILFMIINMDFYMVDKQSQYYWNISMIEPWCSMIAQKKIHVWCIFYIKCIVYIDLAKAFDSSTHEKLLYRFPSIGIGGHLHKWFDSFLIGRYFNVKLDEIRSKHTSVCSGISTSIHFFFQ